MFLAEEATQRAIEIFGMSGKFWIVILVMAMVITAILTAAYNDDKTKGL
ncbi:hypothetical protein [Cohnella caldifontis]|nr:hypothetical protein [Cohnella sp. YIM B05605]